MNAKGQRKKRILWSLTFGFIAEIVNKISPLLVLGMAQRSLGLGGLGSALFAISVIEMTLPFIIFGYTYHGALAVPAVRDDKDKLGSLVSKIVFLRVLHASLAMGGLALLANFLPSWHEHANILLKLLPFLLISAFDVTYINIGTQKMGHLSVWVGLFKLLNLALVYAFVRVPADADLFAIFMMISGAGVSLTSILWVRKNVRLHWPGLLESRQMLMGVTGFAAIVVLYPLFERFDLLVVERILSPEAMGSYVAPWRLVMSLVPLFMVIASTFLSENLIHSETELLYKGAHQALYLSLALTFPIVVASPFVAGDVLTLVFDASLYDSRHLFFVFTLSILAQVFISIWGMQVLLIGKRLRYLAGSLSVGIISGALLALILQRSYGGMGGAIGSMLGRYLSVVIIGFALRPMIRSLPWRDYLDIAVASVAMAVSLMVIPSPWSLFVKVPLAGCVYLLLLVFLQREKLLQFVRRKG